MALDRGTVIDGKYEILKQIGKGGMSVVYLAMDLRLNKQWAVKVIQRKGIGKNNEVVLNKVPDDTELMKRLDHPAIPRIVDIIDKEEDPQIYIVMDYVEGESLDKILDEYGAQSQDLVIDWAKQICDTLGYLHSQKPPIIYRDMKPANIMLKPEGNLKIIDFGISREYKEQNLADTTVLGTKGYAPPEQFGSRQTDARSDIYALGMTMHHLVTGVDPRKQDYVPIKQYNPSLMDGLEIIIDKCVQMNPEDRYQNCNELMYDLEHIELLGIEYKKMQKRKLYTFAISLTLAVILAVSGVIGMFVKHANDVNTYESYIVENGLIDSAVDSNQIATNCFDAIMIDGTRTEAYFKYIENSSNAGELLSANVKDAEGTEKTYDINTYGKYFGNNLEALKERPDFDKLCFDTGYAIFNMLKNDSGSKREAALSAKTYFEYVVNLGENGSNYYNIANSFNNVCQFYVDFVNDTSGNQATKEDFENLVESINYCVTGDNLSQGYEFGNNQVYIELTLYLQFENLLNDYRKSFAKNGIDEQRIVDIYNAIKEKANNADAQSDVIIDMQNEVIKACDDYVDDLHTAYVNTANDEGRGK